MAFPLDRLWQAGLHEIKPASYHDIPAALAFALAATRSRRWQAWASAISCSGASPKRVAREWGHPYGPGLIALGLDPARLLIVETRTAQDAAWALEEGLKSRTLIAALGQAEIREELAPAASALQRKPRARPVSSSQVTRRQAGGRVSSERSPAGASPRGGAGSPLSMPRLQALPPGT